MALSQQQQAELAALVAAYGTAQADVTERLQERIKALLQRLFNFGWFDQALERRVRRELVEVVRDAQEQVADLTGEYLDSVFDVMDIPIPPRLRDRPVTLPKQLRTVTPDEEWQRPGRDARIARLKGLDEFEAQERALWRAEQQAAMDLQLAAQEAEKQKYGVAPEDTILGFRRVLHPERTKGGPCGLCIVAATRVYRRGELKPLHNGCVCTTLPVTKSADPGLDMNGEDFAVWMRGEDADDELKKVGVTREQLEAWYAAAGGTDREGLQRIRVRTMSHGEIGPVLVYNRYRNRTREETEELAEKGMDPKAVFETQDRLVRKYERMLADGNTEVEQILAFHKRARDKWAKKLNDAA